MPLPCLTPLGPVLSRRDWGEGRVTPKGRPLNPTFTHAQLCPTLCDPMDNTPPGSSVHGTLQARILEWVAMPFSRGSSQPRDRARISYVSCIDGQIL